jgi:hypothetical protein
MQAVPRKSYFGFADRLRGCISFFFLAMEYDAAFFISITYPSNLVRSFMPTLIDWRQPQAGHRGKTKQFLVKKSYLYDASCEQLEEVRGATASELAASGMDQPYLLIVESNMWLVPCLWRQVAVDANSTEVGRRSARTVQPADEDLAASYGLPSLRFPAAYAFETLFRPQPQLRSLQLEFDKIANLSRSEKYIGLHIRTGRLPSGATDRDRLHNHQFEAAFECVTRQEKALGLLESTKWYFATDHKPAYGMLREWMQARNMSVAKIVDLTLVGGVINHVAKRAASVDGETFAYLDFLMLQNAFTIAGSESGFNMIAAATGHHRRVIYLPDCVLRSSDELGLLQENINYTKLH